MPSDQCNADVFLLTFLGSTTHQDYQPLAILAKINPVAGNKIDNEEPKNVVSNSRELITA